MRPRPGREPDLPLVDVALEEEDDATAPGAPRPGTDVPGDASADVARTPGPVTSEGEGAPRADPRTRRRRRAAAVGLAAALLGGTVVANVVEARGRAAEAAYLAGVAGVLPDLSEPLEVAWTSTGAAVVAQHDGVLVVQDAGTEGVAGVDLLTGERRWERDLGAEVADCRPGVPQRFLSSHVATSLTLVCRGGPSSSGDGRGSVLTVLRTSTGEVVSELPLEGVLGDFVPLDGAPDGGGVAGDVVVVTSRPAGTLVQRIRALDGSEVWRAEVPVPAYTGLVVGVATMTMQDESGTTVTIDLGSGEQTTARLEPGEVFAEVVDPLPGGRRAVTTYGQGTADVRVESASREALLEREGHRAVVPTVRDDSEPDVVLLAGSGDEPRVAAYDLATDEELWSVDDLGVALAHTWLRGVVVLEGERTLAVDVRTGEVIWERADQQGWLGRAGLTLGLSDGRRFVQEETDDKGRTLVARDLRDGAELWTRQLEGETAVQVADGVLLLVGTDGGLRALVPPGR